jgi:hypothetical protein
MASITLNDLALSEALDYKAMRSIQGALCWANGAFPFYLPVVANPGVFNFYQQINNTWINNSYTYIGKESNQVTNLAINSGSNSTNTAVLLSSTSSQA